MELNMKKLIFIAFLFFASLAGGATNAPLPRTIDNELWVTATGNNANNCTASRPCATLARACTVATRFGTTIRIGAGTFNESSLCTLATGVNIKGSGIGVTTINSTYTGTDGYLIRGYSAVEGVDGSHEISNFSMNGGLVGSGAMAFRGRSNILIHDLSIVDFQNDGILVTGRPSTSIDVRAPIKYAENIHIYNNTIVNSSSFLGGFGHGLIWFGGMKNFSIHDNVLTQVGRTPGTNGFNLKQLSYGWVKDFQIYNNTMTHTDATNFDFVMEIWYILGCGEFYNNTTIGNWDLADIHSQSDTCDYGAYIHHNTLGPEAYSATSHGLQFETAADNVVISNNLFKNVHFSIIIYDNTLQTFFTNYVIQNNLFVNVARGLYMTGSRGETLFTNWKINHNSFYGAPVVSAEAVDLPCGQTYNWEIRNNIIKDFARAPIFGFFCGTGATTFLDSVSYENNILHNNANSNNPFLNGGLTISNFQNRNNIITDPLFVSPTDLHLQAGSPAIDAGIDTTTLEDYNGFIRWQPDIGAYERNGQSVP